VLYQRRKIDSLFIVGILLLIAIAKSEPVNDTETCTTDPKMSRIVQWIKKLTPENGPVLPTLDPFLFLVYHLDLYPEGNGKLAPKVIPPGSREFFAPNEPFKYYHGDELPGFPSHPHRGFETVTVTMEGVVDHCDGLGNSGRYANGDAQWMTAGKGLQHSEMFPLIHKDKPNTLRLFQIWLNLPAASKFCEPGFLMAWNEDIPVVTKTDEDGKSTSVRIISGTVGNVESVKPPKDSWAYAHEVRILLLTMDPGATTVIPALKNKVNSMLYVYGETSTSIAVSAAGDSASTPESIKKNEGAHLAIPKAGLKIQNTGPSKAELLILEGEPINEPIAQQGPFVMNTQEELRQAYADFRKTQFGGWPFPSHEPAFGQSKRFAAYSDGKREEREW
jgi:redox-sensitive bicupin YhaK (pirin superfamily)